MSGKVKIYTEEVNAYIIANAGKLQAKEMAEHIGVSTFAIRAQMGKLRGDGIKVKSGRVGRAIYDEGQTRIRKARNGVQYLQEKRGDKFVTIKRVTPYAPPEAKHRKPSLIKKDRMPTPKKKHIKPAPPPKKEPEKYPTRVIDMTSMKMVRVNCKTEIIVSKTISDEDAIAKWYAKRERQLLHAHG